MNCIKKKIKEISLLKVVTIAGSITVSAFIAHTTIEHDRNIKAVQAVETTIASDCFKDKFLSSELDESQTNGMNKEQVLNHLRNEKVTIELEMYKSIKSTVGYTYQDTERIWMNRKFHDRFTTCEVASNIAHEIIHKLGYGHDSKPTKRRPFSVPYMTGTILGQCCSDVAK